MVLHCLLDWVMAKYVHVVGSGQPWPDHGKGIHLSILTNVEKESLVYTLCACVINASSQGSNAEKESLVSTVCACVINDVTSSHVTKP